MSNDIVLTPGALEMLMEPPKVCRLGTKAPDFGSMAYWNGKFQWISNDLFKG